MSNMLKLLAVGRAGTSNPHAITNAVVTGLPEIATTANPDTEAHKVIDKAQTFEGELNRGELVHQIAIPTFDAATASVGHSWQNTKQTVMLLSHEVIPVFDGNTPSSK
jgi:hypothetical protein